MSIANYRYKTMAHGLINKCLLTMTTRILGHGKKGNVIGMRLAGILPAAERQSQLRSQMFLSIESRARPAAHRPPARLCIYRDRGDKQSIVNKITKSCKHWQIVKAASDAARSSHIANQPHHLRQSCQIEPMSAIDKSIQRSAQHVRRPRLEHGV